MIKNTRIRVALAEKGLRQYDLARIMGISESACSLMMRNELAPEKVAEILKLIEGEKND